MANTTVGGEKDRTNEIRRLSTLLEISQALSGVLNLKAALQSVLEILEKRHQVVGAAVYLIETGTRELHAEASSGERLPGARGRGPGAPSAAAALGWGRGEDTITGRVLDTGKPVVVPRVSQEPVLAQAGGERLRAGRELTYVAVPIAIGRRPGGTLEILLPFKSD